METNNSKIFLEYVDMIEDVRKSIVNKIISLLDERKKDELDINYEVKYGVRGVTAKVIITKIRKVDSGFTFDPNDKNGGKVTKTIAFIDDIEGLNNSMYDLSVDDLIDIYYETYKKTR